ncbi:MAG: MFS transporter [Chlorobiaceae bacterium]|nr:MFS transporter [Chlorobiaceae bacterium]
MEAGKGAHRRYAGLPSGIWVLGFVSMLMDISSELVLSLLPVVMTTVLGASMVSVGLVEGFSEATASILKVFSGVWSDRMRRRKPLALLGYGMSALSKPLFPLSGSVGVLFFARFSDRVGKGIRDAPRDALIAELAPAERRGAAYGLRQALDSAGAFLGPLGAVALMALFSNHIRTVLWAATLPAMLCILLLGAGLKEPPRKDEAKEAGTIAFGMAGLSGLPVSYWLVVLIGALFTMARFSDAFLVLKALASGLPAGQVPLVLVVMNLAYSGISYPAGLMADRFGGRLQLIAGIVMLVCANLVLASARGPVAVMVGVVLWGVHLGLTQGILSKLVADSAPTALLATGFGIFNLVLGIAVLVSSLMAGMLWQVFGPPGTFLAGALFAAVSGAGMLAQWCGAAIARSGHS